MSKATPTMRNFAQQLVTADARANRSTDGKIPAPFHVGENLRPQLATLMGNAGFNALLARALALASSEVPWLRALQVKADGSLEGLNESVAKLDPEDFFEGKIVLSTQLLGLLVSFIGETLTLRLVRGVWPKASLNDLEFGKGGKNEKKK